MSDFCTKIYLVCDIATCVDGLDASLSSEVPRSVTELEIESVKNGEEDTWNAVVEDLYITRV